MRKQVIEQIKQQKLIVILRGIEHELLLPLAQALYDGGIRLLEVTYNASMPEKDADTAKDIALLADKLAGQMFVGAGTVLTEEQVALTHRSGGQFIISPDTSRNVIQKTRELGMVSIPGALTPTEIRAAHDFGADFVKLFPITSLGTAYVKAIKAPLSHIDLLAVGGIHDQNVKDYLQAGVCGFGVGANITDKQLLKDRDFRAITEFAKRYVSAIQSA